MKALQVQVCIEQWFHDKQEGKFTQSLTFLMWSETTLDMY